MKIKSPLTDKKEAEPLCEAGADELFCGIEPHQWRKKYKDFSINQRSTGANFTKLANLEKAISIAHKHKVKIHITINAFFYLEKQYKLAERIIKDVLDIGVDGIIFVDPALISHIDKDLLKDKDVVIGTDAVVFNSAAVKFYKKLGATRVVFPRAMAINEMEEAAGPDKAMEYEVFIIHDLCFFVDGFCAYCKEQAGGINPVKDADFSIGKRKISNGIKKESKVKKDVYFFTSSRLFARGFGGGCRTSFRRQRIAVKNNKQIGTAKPFTFWMKKHIQGCGACAIYDFKKMGITSLKVLDRNLPIEEKVRATGFIKKSLDLLNNNNISKADYIDKCKVLFKKTFKVKCSRYDCYYPDANIHESNTFI